MKRAAMANIANNNKCVTSCIGSGLGEEYVEPVELKAGEFRKSFPSLTKCQNMCS